MMADSMISSPVGRYYILFSSLFSSKPIFEHELKADKRARLMESATDIEEKRLLVKDYEALARVNGLTKYCRWFLWLFTAFHHLSMVSAVFYIYVMHFKIKIFPKESRLAVETDANEPTSRPATYSYACIRSNCSLLLDPKLNASRSELTLDRLPIFSICYPEISNYFEPFQHELGVGTTFYADLILCVLLVDCIVFVLKSGLLVDHSILLFLVAPNLAYKEMLDRAKRHLKGIRHSYKNYLESERTKELRRIECIRSRRQNGAGDFCLYRSRFNRPTITISNMVICKFDHIDESLFARDCLPLIRSKWWYGHLIRLVKWMLVMPFNLFLLAVAFTYYNAFLGHRMTRYMQEMQADVVRANCSFWRQDDELVDLTKFAFGLTTYTTFSSCVVIILWTFLCAVSTNTNLLLSAWELRCWLCELQYKLLMVQPLIKDIFQWSGAKDRLQQDESDLVFRHDKFREQFMEGIHPSWFRIKHKSFVKFTKRVENEQMLEENYYRAPISRQQADPEEDLADLLEKFYVELRLMDELRDNIERKLSMVTSAITIGIYLVCIGSIYVIKCMQMIPLEVICNVILASLCVLMTITNYVALSTQLLKLSPLVESILADLSLATNSQLRHMRTLLWRLMDDLDPKTSAKSGSILLRFTYVTLIQIIFSLATVYLFILKA